MRAEIELTGGTVEKFVGDAVMAVFGAPAALEDHAERALHAALAMQERMRELFSGTLELRVGVNTGDVVVGAPRAGGSFVTGDAVNVADRLEKAAEPGEVLAGERTAAAAAGAFAFTAPRTIDAKGKSSGVVAYGVERALRTMRPRGVSGLRRVFVGRDNELELLRATYRRAAAQSDPHLVTIVGEPGVGKSRLVGELWDALATEEPAPASRTGRCLAYGAGITYWPLGEMVREHFGLREGAPTEEVIARLEGREILGLALGLDVAPELHPLDARERLHAAAVGFVEELASGSPLVLVVEDIHWAEPDLLDLLERLVTDVRAPVMLVATARPEILDVRPTWGTGQAQHDRPLARPTVRRRSRAAARGEAPGAAGGVARPARGARRREPVLPRGARRRARRQRRARPVGGRMGGRTPRSGLRDARHRPRGARRADRPASREREGGAPGGCRDGKGLLDGCGRTSARRRRAGLRRARGARPRRCRALRVAERGPGARNQARAHARGGIRLDSEGSSWTTARLARGLARRGAARTSARPCSHTTTRRRRRRKTRISCGPTRPTSSTASARVPCTGCRAPAGSRADATSSTRRSSSTTARSRCPTDAHERALLWRAVGEAQALRYDGEGMRKALLSALEGPLDDEERADTYALLAFQSSIRSAMWSIRLNMQLIEEWASKALELAADGSEARARALLARANVELLGAPEDVLEEAARLADALGQPGAPLVRTRGANADRLRPAALPGGGSLERSTARAASRDRRSGSSVRGLRGGLARGCRRLPLRRVRGVWPSFTTVSRSASRRTTASIPSPSSSSWRTRSETGRRWLPRRIARGLRSRRISQHRACGIRATCSSSASRTSAWATSRGRPSSSSTGLRLAGEGYETYLSGARLRIALERGDRLARGVARSSCPWSARSSGAPGSSRLGSTASSPSGDTT